MAGLLKVIAAGLLYQSSFAATTGVEPMTSTECVAGDKARSLAPWAALTAFPKLDLQSQTRSANYWFACTGIDNASIHSVHCRPSGARSRAGSVFQLYLFGESNTA
jgi:hypothetical protein